jgi:hypothetical protein
MFASQLPDEGALAAARRSGLEERWDAPTWCNPPYGRELKLWLEKMRLEIYRGVTIIALLPCARREQEYFQSTIASASAICLIRKRVDFISSIDGKAVRGNPYASMLLGFNVDHGKWMCAFGEIGRCFSIEEM